MLCVIDNCFFDIQKKLSSHSQKSRSGNHKSKCSDAVVKRTHLKPMKTSSNQRYRKKKMYRELKYGVGDNIKANTNKLEAKCSAESVIYVGTVYELKGYPQHSVVDLTKSESESSVKTSSFKETSAAPKSLVHGTPYFNKAIFRRQSSEYTLSDCKNNKLAVSGNLDLPGNIKPLSKCISLPSNISSAKAPSIYLPVRKSLSSPGRNVLSKYESDILDMSLELEETYGRCEYQNGLNVLEDLVASTCGDLDDIEISSLIPDLNFSIDTLKNMYSI